MALMEALDARNLYNSIHLPHSTQHSYRVADVEDQADVQDQTCHHDVEASEEERITQPCHELIELNKIDDLPGSAQSRTEPYRSRAFIVS